MTKPRLPPVDDPLWYKDAVIYQLHVKSFFDSNRDGVGDFKGLLQKLDYIAELGVTAIWLLPFYPSPRRDDGYDIADYRGVHPDYGTLADVRRFIAAAHERGLRVIAELVINHTSDQHPWFQRARLARPGSNERNFYVWSDRDDRYSGTRIIFVDTEKSNWTWDDTAKAYFWHRFYSHQPDLNFDNPQVLKEVLAVMRFWLSMGIDGLRLDAVPYLVEREGTNNENLVETHAILKRIRAELDAHAPGRMLLSEANQWPEDAQQYFGDADECHMSFHFPLMPRMYMAIAREDRFPITDIMRQTPEIPENCQWAIFLRNHDELTLEMVTDKERDYLWDTYAHDRRARINLGIRRRLAPLLERDRRRIELMNGLLLSMPGTPVIYYGDEIGMGDNIHLSDRDGVRTPMQWTDDRNGGFSRADPASLVLPAIMDPLYGFQAVNVEAQENDQHSLLHWMRRMLAVRNKYPAFGRGTLRFLYPGNRKILAYLREYGTDERTTVLCVCNLSRTAQAVELDLSTFSSCVPVDIIGGAAFPPIGQLHYQLTLPAYGFFWFALAPEAELPTWHTPAPEMLPEFATVVIRHDIVEAVQSQGRRILETEVLPAYIPKRRWFADRAERLDSITFAYAVKLPGTADVLLTEIEARRGGHCETYALPLAIAWEDETTPALAQQLALARVRRVRRVGMLTDGFAINAFARGVIAQLVAGGSIPVDDGVIRFIGTSRSADLAIAEAAEIRRLSPEDAFAALVIDDSIVLKIVRRVTAGIHPEAEMTRYLTEHGYGHVATLFGEVTRVAADGTPHTLMLAEAFVRHQGDGWTWTLDFLARVVEEIAVTGSGTEADAFVPYANFATILGKRLGEMHEVLSEPTEQPDFHPDVVSQETLDDWGSDVVEQLETAFKTLRSRDDWPDEETHARVQTLVARADDIIEQARHLARQGRGALCTRIHGSSDLAQALIVQDDVFIVGFGGSETIPAERKRGKYSPLRDVARLLRSFDQAAATAGPGRTAASPQAGERRVALLERFRREAHSKFLDAYWTALHASSHPWVTPDGELPLLELFLMETIASEINIDATTRSGVMRDAVRALHEIAARMRVTDEVS